MYNNYNSDLLAINELASTGPHNRSGGVSQPVGRVLTTGWAVSHNQLAVLVEVLAEVLASLTGFKKQLTERF